MERLKEMCVAIWSMLTDDEAEGYFCGMGTIGFVESVADLIFFDLETLSEAEFDAILDAIYEATEHVGETAEVTEHDE
jgi:hypothetical protein